MAKARRRVRRASLAAITTVAARQTGPEQEVAREAGAPGRATKTANGRSRGRSDGRWVLEREVRREVAQEVVAPDPDHEVEHDAQYEAGPRAPTAARSGLAASFARAVTSFRRIVTWSPRPV